MTSVRTLGDLVWPGAGQGARLAREIGLILGGSLLIALGAKLSVPMLPVPVTFQGFAVVFVAAMLGSRRGMLAAVAYLMQGFAGVPVFAFPITGPGYFFGPTAGYLLAFPVAAWIVGSLAARGWDRRFATTIAALALGQAIILIGGFAWLSRSVGASAAFATGVAPFLIADVLKSILGAIALPGGWRIVGRDAKRAR
jgi:biotin transport system substrate-specific component